MFGVFKFLLLLLILLVLYMPKREITLHELKWQWQYKDSLFEAL